jgi:glycosyltransferase involved in cell wall biosynthesis
MPVFNGEPYVEEAVRSLQAQTFKDFELLISDDGSTDQTFAMCLRLAEGDARLRVVRQGEHLGMMANFRYVLDEARAPLFMWAAQDDFWQPTFIDATKALLDSDPLAVGAISAIESSEKDPTTGRIIRHGVIRLPDHASSDLLTRLLAVSHEGPNAIYALFRTDKLRGLKVDLPIYGPDRAIVFQALARGPIAYSDEVLRTQFRVGYEPIEIGGRRVPRKQTGPEGYLHSPNPWPMCRIMLDEIAASDLRLTEKLWLTSDVLLNQWWRTKRNGWLHDSTYRVRVAVSQHRYLRAALLAGRHVILSPGALLRRARGNGTSGP